MSDLYGHPDAPGASGAAGPSGPGQARPWPKLGPLRRFGPLAVVLAVLVAAGAVASVQEHSSPAAASSRGGHHGAPAPAGHGQVTWPAAAKAGTTADYHWQQGCNLHTGHLDLPTRVQPPCVPVFHGSNGGSTWGGVSATAITVVYYEAPAGDLGAALVGATDPTAEVEATVRGYEKLLNSVFELYGRHVNLVIFHATGTSADAVAGRADAITVAQQLHAFASIGGPAQTSSYEEQLARDHVLCIGCGLSIPYSVIKQYAPYIWDLLPTPDALLTEAFDFIVGQLVGRDASYAGDPAFRHEKRVFGIVHYDQNPPVFGSLTTELNKKFGRYGLKWAANESYLLDLTQLPAEAATIVAHLKAAGVTTVVFAGDPIMPIYLSKVAAAQNYFPEWVECGTVFVDTAALARNYSPAEWAHAFGITSLAVPSDVQQSDAYRLYNWFYGTGPPAKKTAPVILPDLEVLYEGIELAGPKLTPANFQAGLFAAPPQGGTPSVPLYAFGYHGAPPRPAYTLPADYAVIWYDATAKGPDEEGVNGTGLYRYVDNGRRFQPTGLLTVPMNLFDPADTVVRATGPPPNEGVPPWPGSPAAKAA